ncbi:phage virion morphogenesis protein [Kaistia sp. MMO-174]|uniref:phage virion morphogenesis protein n=1 Tax=Kaistia sp. MMO-174 TaxID=3081256 RepID=UPI0030182C25
MSGVGISIDTSDLAAIIPLVDGLGDFDRARLLSDIGALGESQTRRRIEEEKAGPDGAAWPENAEGTPILVRTGQHLLQSIVWIAGGDSVEWGATWEYAHVHQFGATIKPQQASHLAFMVGGRHVVAKQVTIPAREFLGLSGDNAADIVELVTNFFGRQIGRARRAS